jgi:tetratricopeptide (TPR) repeat protein
MIRPSVVLSFLLFSALSSFAQKEQVLNNRAVELMDEEKFEEALAILDKLVNDFPSTTSYRYNRAVTLFALEMYERSIADYKYLFADLQEAEYAFQIANAYEQMDSLSLAIPYYSQAISIEGNNYLTFFKRGTVYLKLSEFANAIEDFDRSLQLNPEHHNSLHNRGIALYHSKKPEQACTDWCEAFQLGNTFSEEHIKRNCKGVITPCKI